MGRTGEGRAQYEGGSPGPEMVGYVPQYKKKERKKKKKKKRRLYFPEGEYGTWEGDCDFSEGEYGTIQKGKKVIQKDDHIISEGEYNTELRTILLYIRITPKGRWTHGPSHL